MAAGRIILPCMPALDSNGRPVSGALLNFYENNTTTRKAVYTTADLTTPLSNPVVADAAGAFPSIFADEDELYSVTGFSPAGVMLPKASYSSVRATTAIGDGLVVVSSFMQTVLDDTTALAARTTLGAQSKITVNIKDYGAVGDDVTDDAAAFDAAVAAVISLGGAAIFFPAGAYRIKSKITITVTGGQSIALIGEGRQVSLLDFSDAADLGIDYESTRTSGLIPGLELRNLGIITSRVQAGAAIYAKWNGPTVWPTFYAENLLIGQNYTRASDSGSGFGYWTDHIVLENALNSEIKNLHAWGEASVGGTDDTQWSQYAVRILGASTGCVIADTLIGEVKCGVYVTGTTEGVYISDTEIVQVRTGMWHDVLGEPGFQVNNCHVNATTYSIRCTNSLASIISGCSLFAYDAPETSAWPEWIGVLFEGAASKDNRIVGCNFTKENARTDDITKGVRLAAGAGYVVEGCNYFGPTGGNPLTIGLEVVAGVTDVKIPNSSTFRNVTTPVSNNGTRSYRDPIVQSAFQLNGGGQAGTPVAVTFPQAFTESAVSVIAIHAGAAEAVNIVASTLTTAGFMCESSNAGGAVDIYYIATGY